MTRYVVGADAALRLAQECIIIPAEHQLLAPALMRSQVLSLQFQAVKHGVLTSDEAQRQLDYLRGLRIRLLGDRVLQRAAWRIASQLGWADTFDAEYIALTQLQADALITLDEALARAVGDLVDVAPIEVLSDTSRSGGSRHRK